MGSNSVGPSTAVWSARSAVPTMRWPSARSASAASDGSPQTCSIRTPLTTRFAPTFSASAGSAVSVATGMPARSISLLIVAPQRLQVPQVATSKAPSTPPAFKSAAMFRPCPADTATGVLTPGSA